MLLQPSYHPVGRAISRAVSTPDFNETGLTTDDTWKLDGLDLTDIIPVGATQVIIRIAVDDGVAGSIFQVRQNATNVDNKLKSITQAADILNENAGLVAIDGDRKLDYKGSNLAFTTIDIFILGWVI